MINLAREDESKTMTSYPPPVYPSGMCIYLSDEECEAIGLTAPLPPGTEVNITAKGIVVSSSASVDNDADGGEDEVTMSIQITDIDLKENGKLQNAAAMLYGE
jgi:hypothetical protein